MTDRHLVYLSIGSNVGDKKKNLDTAVDLLDKQNETSVLAVSAYYKTEPQNFRDQDWFVNAAVKIETVLEPVPLLEMLKGLETELDQEGKPFRFGPRMIDLDIIFYDDRVVASQRLDIPHPRMHERCFVLVPLCDIGPAVRHPVLGQTPEELLNGIKKKESQEVILLDKEE